MINVTTYQKDGKTRASVEGLSAVPAIVVKHGLPDGFNDISMFDLNKFDSAKFDGLSDSIKKMIMSSPEYRALTDTKPAASNEFGDDDIPF